MRFPFPKINQFHIYYVVRSKRDGGSDTQRIITFDFIMNDKHPSADRKILAQKLHKIMKVATEH